MADSPTLRAMSERRAVAGIALVHAMCKERSVHAMCTMRRSRSPTEEALPTAGRETYWHITEIVDAQDPSRTHSFTVANDAPRMLRSLAAPYLATHRMVSARRRRASSGASLARVALEALGEPGTQIVLHALLISLTAVR